MTPPEYEKSKFFGFEIWPISNLLGMMMLPKASPDVVKQIKPKY